MGHQKGLKTLGFRAFFVLSEGVFSGLAYNQGVY